MIVNGIDFTSRPSRRKPITCVQCSLEGTQLSMDDLFEWDNFQDFEDALRLPGPWITGADFPFGFARRFIETSGWPTTWRGYIEHIKGMTREAFRNELDRYRKGRPTGDKEHRRAADVAAGAISPQKLYGTPVGLMLFEGAPRLLDAGVTLPGLVQGDPDRIVVETYPGMLARSLIGRRSYKQDTKAKQTLVQQEARRDLLKKIQRGALLQTHGISVEAPTWLADDPGGDHLDALLCAIQAAWCWTQRDRQFGLPDHHDPLEGWIFDPSIR